MGTLLEYQVFPEEYFAGSDVSIYLGDVWLDEAVSFSYRVMEYVMPLYGYNSYVCDYMARGSRAIQGEFAIVFKEPGYLYRVMNSLGAAGDQGLAQRHPIYRTRDKATIALMEQGLSVDEVKSILDNSTKDQIDEIVSQLQHRGGWDTVVQADPQAPLFQPRGEGFTIAVVYGSYVPGPKERRPKLADLMPYAQQILIDVQLTTKGQDVDASGEPIYERYGFIARDIIDRSQ